MILDFIFEHISLFWNKCRVMEHILVMRQSLKFTSMSIYKILRTYEVHIIVTWYKQRHMTMILLYHWWEFWSRDTGVLIILSIFHFLGSSGLSRFPIGCVFAEYDLFKPTTFIQNIININICINLTPFNINF